MFTWFYVLDFVCVYSIFVLSLIATRVLDALFPSEVFIVAMYSVQE